MSVHPVRRIISSLGAGKVPALCGVFLAFSALCCFPGGNTQKAPLPKPLSPPDASITAESGSKAGDFAAFSADGSSPFPGAGAPPATDPRRAEEVMKALAAAYPERIDRVEYRDGDWAVSLRAGGPGGTDSQKTAWYYYAGGRLLPEELRSRAQEFDPQPFYQYPAELAPWQPPGPEQTERFRGQAERRRLHPPKRSQHFYDALWRSRSRDESWERVKSLRFLGRPVMVHYMILEELAQVEERILWEAKTSPQVRAWINSLDTLDGWNWRSIADTQSRSFHAYGAALDLLPKSLGGRETYWLWAARRSPEWWAIPYERRLHPPEAVIRAFEAYGFLWGGKWLFFDTMHFEYRPEILMLNKLPPAHIQ
ncbi:MAG: M15 family metallopeptidase [Treponema sp.]|nr:M15 family metallopeptidase [Treponema sp.]